MNVETDNRKWHIGKEIPVATLIALVLVIASNFVTYSLFKQEVEIFMASTDKEFTKVYARINEHNAKDLDSATVRAMFRHKDSQINDLKSSLTEIKNSIEQLRRDLLDSYRNKRPKSFGGN